MSFGVLAENITPEGVQRSEVHILSLLLSIICSWHALNNTFIIIRHEKTSCENNDIIHTISTNGSCIGTAILCRAEKRKAQNFKYISGDYIYLETKRGEFKLSGKITQINDTSLVINKTSEIGLNDIGVIFRPNGLIRGFSNLFFIQGGGVCLFFLLPAPMRWSTMNLQ